MFDFSLFSDAALLLLRAMVAIMFISSGVHHMAHPRERGKSIGYSTLATFGIGVVEVASSIGFLLGVYLQVAALLIVATMLVAMCLKIFHWHTGFFGKQNNGWYYDLLLLAAAAVVLTLGGGNYTLSALF